MEFTPRRIVRVTSIQMMTDSPHDFIPYKYLVAGTRLGTYKGPYVTVLELLTDGLHLGMDHSFIELVLDTEIAEGDSLYMTWVDFKEELIVKGTETKSIR